MNALKNTNPVVQSSNLLCRTSNPLKINGFTFLKQNSVTSVSKLYNYRKARIVKAKSGWYIIYYYRIPVNVRHLHGGKEWKRFRLKEDINRRAGDEREEFAESLRDRVNQNLKDGYNPFDPETAGVESEEIEQPVEVNAQDAFKMFLAAWSQRGLEPESLAKYKKCVNRLGEYLHKNKMLYGDVKNITTNHIEAFLNDGRKTYKFSNREYNNTFDFIRTCFNYLVKKEIIPKSPCAGVDKLKTKSTKHRFYNEKSLKDITAALIASDPYTYLAIQTVYYLCIRSDKELMNLKVGNIQWEQNKILLEAEGTKGNSDGYIPMDNNIKALFLSHGIDKYPSDYYVFGIKGAPAAEPFGRGFFAKRFRKVRDAAGLSDQYTLYGAKHTRIIHLKQDGLDDATIMALTRHRDFAAYAKYLRDLGLDANPDKINKVSRKM